MGKIKKSMKYPQEFFLHSPRMYREKRAWKFQDTRIHPDAGNRNFIYDSVGNIVYVRVGAELIK